jgi:hypothetical protein
MVPYCTASLVMVGGVERFAGGPSSKGMHTKRRGTHLSLTEIRGVCSFPTWRASKQRGRGRGTQGRGRRRNYLISAEANDERNGGVCLEVSFETNSRGRGGTAESVSHTRLALLGHPIFHDSSEICVNRLTIVLER